MNLPHVVKRLTGKGGATADVVAMFERISMGSEPSCMVTPAFKGRSDTPVSEGHEPAAPNPCVTNPPESNIAQETNSMFIYAPII